MSDASPPEKKVSPEEESRQLLHLIKDCSDNLRHAKSQQWQAGHLTLLAYAALVFTAHGIPPKDNPLTPGVSYLFVVIWFIAVSAACAAGIGMVWNLQFWMKRLRASIKKAEDKLSTEYREIASPMHGDNYESALYKPFQSWLITFAIGFGWIIAFAMSVVKYIWR